MSKHAPPRLLLPHITECIQQKEEREGPSLKYVRELAPERQAEIHAYEGVGNAPDVSGTLPLPCPS